MIYLHYMVGSSRTSLEYIMALRRKDIGVMAQEYTESRYKENEES
jgi:hypothetical protein